MFKDKCSTEKSAGWNNLLSIRWTPKTWHIYMLKPCCRFATRLHTRIYVSINGSEQSPFFSRRHNVITGGITIYDKWIL